MCLQIQVYVNRVNHTHTHTHTQKPIAHQGEILVILPVTLEY